ncbi:hypothetical protein HUW51_11060 [Adhaeribacter swui]|uniref:Uncharacterized protein n=1 Tax=Adhaeribacter swui TaxID=2086471 RepID=A0A7G7G7V4_9BACT|nr:hypothetical protein [Adhaeribacter swui]QNF33238.1 hypothetical protein HUW51_11060 [Adhaeribacter swui]
MKNRSKEINEQIEFGLDSIDPKAKIEIKLKDFMLIYKTMEEFNRFFQQRMNYPTIKDIETYMGNRDTGAYSVIHNLYYNVLEKYIPKEISEKFGEENDPFDNPRFPYYYNINRK